MEHDKTGDVKLSVSLRRTSLEYKIVLLVETENKKSWRVYLYFPFLSRCPDFGRRFNHLRRFGSSNKSDILTLVLNLQRSLKHRLEPVQRIGVEVKFSV